jgi:hypothetical protein
VPLSVTKYAGAQEPPGPKFAPLGELVDTATIVIEIYASATSSSVPKHTGNDKTSVKWAVSSKEL